MDIQDMRIFARVAAVQNLSAVGTELDAHRGKVLHRRDAGKNAHILDVHGRSPHPCDALPRVFRHSPSALFL